MSISVNDLLTASAIADDMRHTALSGKEMKFVPERNGSYNFENLEIWATTCNQLMCQETGRLDRFMLDDGFSQGVNLLADYIKFMRENNMPEPHIITTLYDIHASAIRGCMSYDELEFGVSIGMFCEQAVSFDKESLKGTVPDIILEVLFLLTYDTKYVLEYGRNRK